MYLADLSNRGNIPVLEKLMAFASARHDVLAGNIANLDTPDYRSRRLDPRAFQSALRQAVDERGNLPERRLELPATDQFQVDERGHLAVTPTEEPANNILFHDGTNARIELEMSYLADNMMAYNMSSQLLKNSFEGLRKAIRGQV